MRRIRTSTICLVSGVLFLAVPLILSQTPALIRSTPAGQRLAWHQYHLRMQTESPYNNLKWAFIGPDIISGRITSVAVHSNHRQVIYVGSASGGVWRSANAGTTWQPLLETALSASVGAVALAPSHPDIIWVGSGEANMLRSSQAGAGVYRSLDAGQSWEHRGLAGTHTIGRIVIHPRDPDVVYVAASGHMWTDNPERGVYRSRDGGRTWEKILFIDDKTGVIDLVMDPRDPDILYAAAWQRIRKRWRDPNNKPGYSGSGIYKSTDGGDIWVPINRGLPPAEQRGRIGLAVALSDSDVLYAILDNQTRKPKGAVRPVWGRPAESNNQPLLKGVEVYRSHDRGESWVHMSREQDSLSEKFMYPGINWFGWVFGQIRVDPEDKDTVYLLGVSLLKSEDGGRTFRKLSYPGLHADHHALWIDPHDPDYLVNGNDGGINISYDGGLTWQNSHAHLPVSQFYSVAVDMEEPFNVYASPQDHGCVKGPVNSRPGIIAPQQRARRDWVLVPGGEYVYVAVDPSDSDLYYSGNIQKSVFSGGSWDTETIRPEVGEDEPPLRKQCLTPFMISPHNSSILYLGTQYLYRTPNRGESWERLSPDLTYNNPDQMDDVSFATISAISESPLKFGLIYVGTDDGRVQVTKDHGQNWDDITNGLPFNKHVSRVTASAFGQAVVYLALNGKRDDDFAAHLYMSRDYGENWRDISSNIPGAPVNVIREDPKKSGVLYVGTDMGVYVSVDNGEKWDTLGSGLPIIFVHDLVVHPRDPILVIATHGRGLWALDVALFQRNFR